MADASRNRNPVRLHRHLRQRRLPGHGRKVRTSLAFSVAPETRLPCSADPEGTTRLMWHPSSATNPLARQQLFTTVTQTLDGNAIRSRRSLTFAMFPLFSDESVTLSAGTFLSLSEIQTVKQIFISHFTLLRSLRRQPLRGGLSCASSSVPKLRPTARRYWQAWSGRLDASCP
jgi:hypothetical protein